MMRLMQWPYRPGKSSSSITLLLTDATQGCNDDSWDSSQLLEREGYRVSMDNIFSKELFESAVLMSSSRSVNGKTDPSWRIDFMCGQSRCSTSRGSSSEAVLNSDPYSSGVPCCAESAFSSSKPYCRKTRKFFLAASPVSSKVNSGFLIGLLSNKHVSFTKSSRFDGQTC
eukprot:scaffold51757_cov42-Cyclotella_meneghiniana.AAC.13